MFVDDPRNPNRVERLHHHHTPHPVSEHRRAGQCNELMMQGTETVSAWNVQGLAVWAIDDRSLLHTLQIEGDQIVARTEHPMDLLSVAFAEDVIYLFTPSALLVVERCGTGPWLEEADAWGYDGPALSVTDALGSCTGH
ncbi:MAG: hypothetical protein AAF411_03750 [Myxococcota bacterium]